MAHPLKEREFLVDQSIKLGIFKTLAFDKENNQDERFDKLVKELESEGVNPNEAYRVVTVLNGEEQVVYTSRDGLVEILKDEEGFEFVWTKMKENMEQNIDHAQGYSMSDGIDLDELDENIYEDL